ncbi:YibE/F family protein [Candidatus Falkowbacteria bacterium]|jgi:uncharacterized membrane protein|nr:YibE/F family protein [Patescibacteria group bacterium]MDD3435129.1 YibE/F family protein [Patescibacteria group bacterium]MDD4466415.1 YibE/F family protein [Patescibacteria group bacterium]NCU42735.1 YibE/F family protein [Candidatus Falkowbacteria bacterium]
MRKILYLFIGAALFLSFFAFPAQAQEVVANSNLEPAKALTAEAEVLKIVEERNFERENGQEVTQQNLELGILTGSFKGQVKNYYGISELDVVAAQNYKVGDKVVVSYDKNEDGEYSFYIIDFVRTPTLIYLGLLFVVIVLLVGGKKGLLSLLSLTLTFLLIIKVLVPLLFKGWDPLWTGISIAALILLALIYLTEGLNKKAHLAVLSIIVSLLITALLAWIFGSAGRLSGAGNEEVIFLIDSLDVPISFHRLLLASIIIGALGVLDDIVVGQIEAVYQLKEANPELKPQRIFKMGLKISRTHLGAIINTLFLAYVSASLPLVLLFNVHQEPFLTTAQIINNENIATEIVRTLVGVIGICLAAPLATFLAAYYLNPPVDKKKSF